jgi:hypothetical protein
MIEINTNPHYWKGIKPNLKKTGETLTSTLQEALPIKLKSIETGK